ncbi:MAG: Ppx/GppA phosphatase family protein [Pseudomonadota bacterium]
MKEPDDGRHPSSAASTSGATAGHNNAGDATRSVEGPSGPDQRPSQSPSGNPSNRKRRRNRRRRKQRGEAAAPQQSGSASLAVGQPESDAAATQPPVRPDAPRLYAALDLGTNNCRLLVATPTKPGQFRVVDAFSRIVRLGEGFGASGRLSENAMDRALEALKVCSEKLNGKTVRKARLIATEACRSADNGAAFLERVQEHTGLELEVVDRETEARLAVSGCGSLVDRAAKSTVLFDIGGGSSEIAVIDLTDPKSRRLADGIVDWVSLPVGVVTMSEKFGGEHVNAEIFAKMKAYAAELLNDFAAKHENVGRGDHSFHLIGTSGTVTTLAGIHLDLPRYDRRRVDGLWINARQVSEINNRILNWSFDQRKANPCIGADRADLVLAGCAILEAIRDAWPAKRLRVADRGLREGLLTEMMSEDGAWRSRRRRNNRHRYRSKDTAQS